MDDMDDAAPHAPTEGVSIQSTALLKRLHLIWEED